MTERHLQQQFVDYLRFKGWLVIQTYLGSKRGGSIWMTKGLPDLYVLKNGRHIWMEVKTAAGRVKPEQAILHKQLREAGAQVHVVRSLEDVQKAIEEIYDQRA